MESNIPSQSWEAWKALEFDVDERTVTSEVRLPYDGADAPYVPAETNTTDPFRRDLPA